MKPLSAVYLLSFAAAVIANVNLDNLQTYFHGLVNANDQATYKTYIAPAMQRFLFTLQFYGSTSDPKLLNLVQSIRLMPENYAAIFGKPRRPELTTGGMVFAALKTSFSAAQLDKIVSDNDYFFGRGMYEGYQKNYFVCQPTAGGFKIDAASLSDLTRGYINGNFTQVFNTLPSTEIKSLYSFLFDNVRGPNLIYKHGFSYLDVAAVFERRLDSYKLGVSLPRVSTIKACIAKHSNNPVFVGYTLRNFMLHILDAFTFYAFQTTRAIYANKNGGKEYNDPTGNKNTVTFYQRDYPVGSIQNLTNCFPEFFQTFKTASGKYFVGSGNVYTAQYTGN